MTIYNFLSATALASAALLPHAAFAQTTATPGQGDVARQNDVTLPEDAQDENEAGQTITVTGSRISRPNLDSTTPVSAISATELLDTGELSLGDELSRLPQLRSTVNQANSTANIGTAGINSLDLRGLGTARTLTLVNGRRHVTSSPGAYTVDTNTIPTALLERVDIATGGTSAVYGSDAISGVVNFVTKRDFEGIDLRVQGGVSDRGDRGAYTASLVAGKNFAEGRGNIAIAVEYAKQNSLLFEDRDAQTGAYSGVPGFYQVDRTIEGLNPNGTAINEPNSGDDIPDQAFIGVNGGPYPGGMIVGGNRFGFISLGGTVQTVCPAATATNAAQRALVCTGELSPTNGRLSDPYVFLPDGTLVRDDPTTDLRSIGGGRFGGLTATGIEGAMLLPGLDRINTNILASFEVSSAFQPFFEGKYVRITANQTSTQPTFVNGTLTPTFYLDNPFLSAQARSTIQAINNTTSNTAGFSLFRFNNDIGTRAEDHKRETYRFVGGVRGDISSVGNVRYEASFNYGRTSTFYETNGNVDVGRFNAAKDAVRNSAGQIVCRVNADASTTNDRPGCQPLNLFGVGNASQEAIDYVLYTSTREQWADQINAVAFIAGDSAGLFRLPGGPVGFSLGGEYRREDAFSDYDDYTQSGATFLNSISAFAPPAIEVYEGFGELRLPLLRDLPFIRELSLEGAARYSKYSTADDGVWAYNVGLVYAPVRDIRVRAGYARAVRAPNLSEVYATRSQTFANNFVDPCSQGTPINANPNRARNCAAAGIPETITLPDGSVVPWTNAATSGITGFNQGNPNLAPETSKSFTVGAVFEPRFLPGFSLTVDYYNIEVNSVIAGLSGQGIVDRCYDDPVGLDNPFCAAVFRRTSTDPIANFTFDGQSGRRFAGFDDFQLPVNGPGFLNQPFNYAALKTSGIDVDAAYRRTIGAFDVSARVLVSWLANREQFTFITDPERSTRVHGTLGDPEWGGAFNLDVRYRQFDFGYDARYVGKQTVGTWETQFSHQGRDPTNADAFPFKWYPETFYHNAQIGIRANDSFRLFFGVDNILDTLPPYGLTGTGAGSAIYPVTGRNFYAGARITF